MKAQYIKGRFNVLMTVVMGFVLGVQAVPTITDVTAQQRYPWNGKFDISYTAIAVNEECWSSNLTASLKVYAVEQTTHVTNVANAAYLSGDTTMSNGIHTLSWDLGAQGAFNGLVSSNFEVFVSAEFSAGGVQLWEGGPLWAECNIGANKPEEYGYYFWWGDTVGYKRNANNDGWVSAMDGQGFSFINGNCPTYMKNNDDLTSTGYIDSTGNLTSEHDAATVHFGSSWRMPTDSDFSALYSNCNTVWASREGVSGLLVSGRGKYASSRIFLPAGGFGYSSSLDPTGSYGYYWTSSPCSASTGYAWYVDFQTGKIKQSIFCTRFYGQSIRPIRESDISSNSVIKVLCVESSGAIRADLRSGEVRTAEATETLTYSTEWDGGDTATIAVNGNSVFQGSGNGTYLWTPSVDGLNEVTHTVITSGVSVVETARFMVVLGTQDKPWRIGATANDSVVAWTNETGTLVIGGAGAMKDFAADGSNLPWPSAAIRAVAIADSVTRIGAYAYKGCSGVTAIEVPASVTTVGSGAFQDCSTLKSVTFKGQAPTCGDNVFTGTSADMVVSAEAGTAGWVQWNGRPLAFVNSGSGSETVAKAQLTVTNVVIHYVVNSVMPEKVYPVTNDTGFVNIITEVKSGGAVAVPETWADNYPGFKEKFGDNFTKSLMKPTGKRDGAGNAMCVWQDYVAGTDPTEENDKFTASITIDADGNLIISYSPELTDAEKVLRVYKTWGKVKLQDTDWVEVPEGRNADYNFFKVSVEMK